MDIDEQILAALQIIFTQELIAVYPGDRLQLLTLKQDPLQDDPTIVAPYVTYASINDGQRTIRLVSHEEYALYGPPEIGGPIKYLHFFYCKFGTPLAQTRDQARRDGAILMTRIMETLIRHRDLSNVLQQGMPLSSVDQSKVIEGNNNLLIPQAGYHIYGGEQTFYAKGEIGWQYPVSWNVF